MITRRDAVVALVAVAATAVVVGAADPKPADIQGSTVFDWAAMQVRETKVGSVRSVVRKPTRTLDELEMHVTTLKPGETSHPPHQHPNEELIILKEGTVEVLNLGQWRRVEVGSIVFNASNDMHALRNVGTGPATYHVVNWTSPGMKGKPAQ
jgi:XRE family transcriptional regulator, regulator of sulfur utilization